MENTLIELETILRFACPRAYVFIAGAYCQLRASHFLIEFAGHVHPVLIVVLLFYCAAVPYVHLLINGTPIPLTAQHYFVCLAPSSRQQLAALRQSLPVALSLDVYCGSFMAAPC